MDYGDEIDRSAKVKRRAPAAERNSAPIADVLQGELPDEGVVLEIASGTGQHAVFFANRFPQLEWQPSDTDPEALGSILAWVKGSGAENLLPPVVLDASSPPWPIERADAVVCINMVHISPWEATEGLFRGAATLLNPGAPLILYGPYLEADREAEPSNLAFDADLKRRNPSWGLRQREEVDRLAAECGFQLSTRYEMPANNLTLIYRRT